MIVPTAILLATAIGFLPAGETHWGGPPPCGPPAVQLAATEGHGGFAYPDECRITVNPNYTWTRQEVCTLMVHETGHLRGLGHTPGTVMDADTLYPPPECPPDLAFSTGVPRHRHHSWKHKIRKRLALPL